MLRIATADDFIESLRLTLKKQGHHNRTSKFGSFVREFRRFCYEQEAHRRIDFQYLFDLLIQDFSAIQAITRNITAKQQAKEDQELIAILKAKGVKLTGRKGVRGPKITRYFLDRMHQKIYGYERRPRNQEEAKKIQTRENQQLNAILKKSGRPQIERSGKGVSRSQYSRWNILHWMMYGFAINGGSRFRQIEDQKFMTQKEATSNLARWLLLLGLENTSSKLNPRASLESAIFDDKAARLAATLSRAYRRGNARDLPGLPSGYAFSSMPISGVQIERQKSQKS